MKAKYLSWVPAVTMMIVIFSFSAKPAINSNMSSMVIVNQIINSYQNITHIQYQPEVRQHITDVLNLVVRKSAHFCEYALLAFTVAFHFFQWKRKGLQLFLLPVITAFLYAASDEFHQTFVPGRSGCFRDVMIDTSGAILGTLTFIFITTMLVKGAKRKKTSAKA